jgi:hypothetical protein
MLHKGFVRKYTPHPPQAPNRAKLNQYKILKNAIINTFCFLLLKVCSPHNTSIVR